MDVPNSRSSHTNITPSHGGTAIFASIMMVFTLLGDFTNSDHKLHLIIPALVVLFFIGLKDDILIASPLKKIIAQVLASLIVIIGADIRIGSFFGIFGLYELPYLVSLLSTAFVMVVITNAFNLIDGIDGLAGGLGMIAATIFGIYFFQVDYFQAALLCAVLVGALAGFLYFNFSKTNKIFMGDSGSLVMGFTLAVMAIQFIKFNEIANSWHFKNAPAMVILILGIPLFDTLRVFAQRALKGKSPFYADRTHIHHFLIDSGLTHTQATLVLLVTSIGISVLGSMFILKTPTPYSFLILLIAFVVYCIAIRFPVEKKKKIPTPAIHIQRKPEKSRINGELVH